MSQDRRAFLQLSLATGAAFAAGSMPAFARATQGKPKQSLKLLVLGGTGFLGPAIVRCAQERGHTLTLFNRNKTRTELFPDVERLQGDRDPKKGDGLKKLEGDRRWDVVFDDCGYYPRMVKSSAELLAPRVQHYIYISSISAYKDNATEGLDETAEVATMADPTVESMGENYANYGALKALCEQAAEKAMPGKVANVRPGYIVGPEDFSDRFTYWPLRVERGGEVLAPGAPSDPIQIIDVRDLAEWLVHIAEERTTGVFNACGPAKRLGMGEMLAACKQVTNSNATFTWVPAEFLEKQGPLDLPIWAPYMGETKGANTWSNVRAIRAGLKFRSIETTVKDTLAWYHSLPEERQKKPKAGLTAADEARVLAAYAAK